MLSFPSSKANWTEQRWSYIAVVVARHSEFAAIEADGEPLCIQDAALPRPGVVGVVVRAAERRHVLLPVRGACHPTAVLLRGQRGEGSLWAQVTALHTSGHGLGANHGFMGEVFEAPAFDSLLSNKRAKGGVLELSLRFKADAILFIIQKPQGGLEIPGLQSI